MELRFVSPHMRQMDTVGSEVLACCLFEDERPVQGMAGLLDWRLATRLSRWMGAGELTGARGEVALLAGKPRVPFEKLLLFGLGSKARFDEEVFLETVHRMLETLSGLRVRMAVVERPGRHTDVVDALRGTDLILEACEGHGEQDLWTLVENMPDQKRITQHLAEERRRKRMR
ncbi:MAG: leucyl aminopeptidase [Deltaproteobacteria bacterium HGW-Deltaproteobacteria-20]|nr:MAG: leucyl aminopeptidase [Deltaproteobacteria bacterium HGW-Deltaproteobacteria-20]